ncbi:hypothetical protein GOARA_027_00370 [Gordonia araii NBRC 100433]|uniref:Phosphopantetheine adenylyltransferase n=1 Tax=Gordonia araii NBRC 100433 TaxID=1073574 RepID=G7GZP9_9ACTN|nr:hypothetical protein [Gordonia araii]NNG98863.1 phosphopantetheine adenylyltransferase [Gordonia araii NBRC 100433]GAB09074.1 hypothetical protein GOARA_027_00370 [Gordonia araii NBRC 100433]
MLTNRLTQLLMIAAGALHLIPATAAASRERIEALYGITVPNSDVELLLRHRAVLFAVLGVALIAAAFSPRSRVPVIVAGLVAMGSWVGLAGVIGTDNPQLDRVTRGDVVGVVALIAAAVLSRRATSEAYD